MAITLGTFTKQDNGTFAGTLKTLNVAAALSIVPVDKMSDNLADKARKLGIPVWRFNEGGAG